MAEQDENGSIARRAQEEERDRLARAIHDDPLQVLAAVAMRLQLVRRQADAVPGDEVAVDARILDESIEDVRNAIDRLRSLTLGGAPAGPAVAGPEPARSEPGAAGLWSRPELLSRLSHDLRSPLNAVLGFAQLLELGDLDEDQAEAVGQIMRAGRRLLELVEEIVDLTRIETGQLDLSLEQVELRDVIHEAIGAVRPMATGAAVELHAPADLDLTERSGGSPAGATVMADRKRLVQVLTILLSNAVRSGQPGGHVRVEIRAERPVLRSAGRVRVGVRDDGPGIATDRLRDVFTPFDRAGPPDDSAGGGGLGLAIAKAILDRMGGTIAAESSEREGGSLFWFELAAAPVEPSEAELDLAAGTAAPAPDPGEAWFEVLYVEDNPAAVRLVERVLARRPGTRVVPARDGRTGIELAIGRQPSLILVDLHLPDMPGSDVVRALSSEPATRDIPLAVLSAQARSPSEPQVRLPGTRAMLTKPFDIDELLNLVDAVRAEAVESVANPRRR